MSLSFVIVVFICSRRSCSNSVVLFFRFVNECSKSNNVAFTANKGLNGGDVGCTLISDRGVDGWQTIGRQQKLKLALSDHAALCQ